ncbi:uncharacterized protein LOC143214532 [Lasioglossum baleicum]|uniref:uncharacterized protein LOC143214532 n=1 Tax=Lasioglossum baleicum TaxID=434251 RepID=UPI003FCCC7AC
MNAMQDIIKDVKLIEAVRSRIFLYDLQHPRYMDLKYKDIAWREIAEEVGLPVYKCKNRWQSIRSTYRKYRSRNAMRNEQAASSERHTFRYGNSLDFLVPFCQDKVMLSSLDENSVTSEETTAATSTSQDTASGRLIKEVEEEDDFEPPPKRGRKDTERDLLDTINRCGDLIERSISGIEENTSQPMKAKVRLLRFFETMALEVFELSQRGQDIVKMNLLQKISEIREEEEQEREQRERDLRDSGFTNR